MIQDRYDPTVRSVWSQMSEEKKNATTLLVQHKIARTKPLEPERTIIEHVVNTFTDDEKTVLYYILGDPNITKWTLEFWNEFQEELDELQKAVTNQVKGKET